MPVITAKCIQGREDPAHHGRSIISNSRKYIASESLFTVTDILYEVIPFNISVKSLHVQVPEFEYGHKFRAYGLFPNQEESQFNLRYNNHNPSNAVLLSEMFPDTTVLVARNQHSHFDHFEVAFPCIKLKSVDNNEETLFFFSTAEAQTALDAILEAMNNG